ncbi:flagellar protein FliS [Cellulomonas triticagri]|uniref:Flagellar protein FliS n=1 Tax=Cellulomonas triticagri TaxID=2483352 RepID=A0A3M2J8E5_9CELL|nr:flagellar protein FliS [Cellulomonas triticagri]
MIDVRSRYLADTVATAAPARLLTMLFDRLLLDLARGEESLRTGERPQATQHLAHGQEILAQLMADLNTSVWDGGEQLLSIYSYALSQLIDASRVGDADRVATCRELLAPIGEAWHQAADALATDVPTQRTASTAPSAGLGVLGVG